MGVDHLHWNNSVTKRTNERWVEFLSRFPDGKKYNNNGTEIE